MSAEFVAHMEDVLDLYAEPYDPKRPVVCFDETSTQLLAETRAPMPPRPGRPQRQDYEYRREGTRNLFLACEGGRELECGVMGDIGKWGRLSASLSASLSSGK